jgi:hypothetical protein
MRILIAAIAVTLAIVACAPANAHGSLGRDADSDLKAMAEAANLVVVAEIANIEYRNTPIKGEQGTIPTSLVTLKISEVLRGQAPQGPLTLRFLGGPDGRGGIAGVSGVPMFAAGETNILFIKASGDAVCPLTNCEWGRFRVLNGAVYNTHGSPVYSVSKGRAVAFGRPPKELSTFRFPTPSFDAVMQQPFVKERFAKMNMSVDEARARYEKEAPKFIEYRIVHSPEQESAESVDEAPPVGVTGPLLRKEQALPKAPMSLKGFLAALTPIAKSAKRAPQPVASADLSLGYALPGLAPATPPPPKRLTPPPVDPAAADEAANPLGKPQKQQKPIKPTKVK